ncbi:MAG: M23 family metallopeptidase [Kofleriaceae bacterium]
MKKTLLLAGCLASASASTAFAEATCYLNSIAAGNECTKVIPPVIPSPSGMGEYCSTSKPDGTWDFNFNADMSHDPCSMSTGTYSIERAGMFSATQRNYVVERCDGHIGNYFGAGIGPLTSARTEATQAKRRNCTFTVAPAEFPIFDAPIPVGIFTIPPGYFHATGFDHVRFPFNTVAPADFGLPGTKSITEMDSDGADRTNMGFIEDHAGDDLRADVTAEYDPPVRAVADGVIDMIRARDVSQTSRKECQGNGLQAEIYIRHTVRGNSGKYEEIYESYYAHMHDVVPFKVGDIVKQGQLIGHVGHAGCTGGTNHLHFGVFKISNTASAHLYPLIIRTGPFSDFTSDSDGFASDKGYRTQVDPYGFTPPTTSSFDPWAYRGWNTSLNCQTVTGAAFLPCDWGTLSSWLWNDLEDPPLAPSDRHDANGNEIIW